MSSSAADGAQGALPDLESAAFRQRLHSRVSRLWQAMRRYPLPSASLALLLLALALALTGRATLAQWALLAIIVIGGVPLLLQTLRQLWRREFGIDLIAILAIAGSDSTWPVLSSC